MTDTAAQKTEVRFFIGQTVTIDQQYSRADYGAGPFLVVRVQDVPTHCNCGLTAEDLLCGREHHERCISRTVESVGHSQWVWIATEIGERHFSGKLLIPTDDTSS